MRATPLVIVAGGALIAALLTPAAQAVPSSTPQESAAPVSPQATSGANCQWGTEPARVIPHIDYPRGYLDGNQWRRDYAPPTECALGPAWTPIMHAYPFSVVQATTEEYGAPWADQRLCTGIADPRCAPGEWKELYAESALGFCENATDFHCVEGLAVIDPDGGVQQARFLRGFPQTPEIPEFNQDGLFFPAGGSVPLWEYDTPQGTQRMLTVGKMDNVFRIRDGRWTVVSPTALFKFILRPVTIESRPGIPKPTVDERVDPSNGRTVVSRLGWERPQAVGCAAIEQDECAVEAAFPEGYRYQVTFRLRNEAAMYLNGALDAPVAYSEEIPGGHRFILEAAPSPVLGMAGWIPKSQIPRALVDQVFDELKFNYNWELDYQAASHKSLGRGGRDSLAWLKALLPYFGDRASFIVDAWYFENSPPSPVRNMEQCLLEGKGEFVGIVASNATAYTGEPPIYDPLTSTLKYEVAGPHYMPDGTTLSRGRYSINMNADYVKCLLGVDKVPSVARVELIYPDGEASAATLALQQDKNWLRLNYENFTFSNPTVSVQFPKSLTCFKGKGKRIQSKTFAAFECPKGWRPRR